MRRVIIALGLLLSFTARAACQEIAPARNDTTPRYDIIVYGGAAGGVIAALQARKMGKAVLLIEPGNHVGGLTSGGLGATDIGNKGAIGGLAREFYQRVKSHYAQPEAWRQEKATDYHGWRELERTREDAMWTFEPHVAEKILEAWLREAGVKVIKNDPLHPERGLAKFPDRPLADSIKLKSGTVARAEYFIDASYEGDLLAAAGVSFHVGREANSLYGESLNGVQVKNAVKHQLMQGVDPYVKKGDPTSGLLPGVQAGPPGVDGEGDARVQAYNFRMCLTDAPDNRLPIEKPAGYDEREYELLFRNFEAGETRAPWNPLLMPNRKTDINNNYGFSTDFIGQNYAYPTTSAGERARIFAAHLAYQQGLVWTLANHPRVPQKIRDEVSRWGLCRDEFQATGGWPHQLYVREARRMIGEVVMTQQHCQGYTVAEDSVGLAAYTMDSHNVQRYVDAEGFARNEGDVQVGGFPPYPISYRSLLPKRGECDNLLAPVCLSASHIAYGSIRMEPVFMVLGQSAATAACLAIDEKNRLAAEPDAKPQPWLALHDLPYETLRARLLADKQILSWDQKQALIGMNPATLPGLIVDDEVAEYEGNWTPSRSTSGYIGHGYRHSNFEPARPSAKTSVKTAKFTLHAKKAGRYRVGLAYTPHPNRASNAPATISFADREQKVTVDQRQKPSGGVFHTLATIDLSADGPVTVVVETAGADGFVVVDAVQLIEAE